MESQKESQEWILPFWPKFKSPLPHKAVRSGTAGGIERDHTYQLVLPKRFRKGYVEISLSGSSHRGSLEMNPTSIYKDAGSIPGLAPWVKDPAWP